MLYFEIDIGRAGTPDPHSEDSDSDGMTDGWEVTNRLNPLSNDAYEDPDEDSLLNMDEYAYGTNPWLKEIENPEGDDDDDGLTNLEEFLYGTNPNSDDSDGDGMLDKWEVDNSLDPLVDDSSLDLDEDGLVNAREYSFNTNPFNADTDVDGLSDFDEINGIHGYVTNPAKADSDGDGLKDGIEVKGWDVIIADKAGAKDPYCVTTNPLKKEDRDRDGLYDYDEWKAGTDPRNVDTDGDHIGDRIEVEEQKRDLKQYNPLIKENLPPKINRNDINIKHDLVWKGWWKFKVPVKIEAMVNVRATDPAGVNSVRIEISGESQRVSYEGGSWYKASETWKILSWKSFRRSWGGYDIEIRAYDKNGNEATGESHVKGVKDYLSDVAKRMWMKLKSWGDEALKFVKEMVAYLVEAFEAMIDAIVRRIVDPIVSAINGWVTGMQTAITAGFGVLLDDDPGNDMEFNPLLAVTNIFDAVMNKVFYTIVGIVFGLEVLSGIVNIITGGSAGAAKLLIEQVAFLIISALFSIIVGSGIYDLLTKADKEGEGMLGWLREKLKNVLWGYAGLAMAISSTMAAGFKFATKKAEGSKIAKGAFGFALAIAGLAKNIYTAAMGVEGFI